MAISLDGLDGNFRNKVEVLLQQLLEIGVEMRPYFGLRTPEEQAKLWRQSRSKEEIAAGIAKLNNGGAHYLAGVLDAVGPQHGPEVTKALPGLSWHQWGEALDCFWVRNGTAEWSTTAIADGVNGYKVYAQKAKEIGLEPGGHWVSLKDWPHVQFRHAPSPALAGMTLAQIDAAMKTKYG